MLLPSSGPGSGSIVNWEEESSKRSPFDQEEPRQCAQQAPETSVQKGGHRPTVAGQRY